jgi:hypothetical protein
VIHEYPTNFFEAICWPVVDFVSQWWQHASHPSVQTMICMGIVIKVALVNGARAARAARDSKAER